jgi:hypothetical protein
MRGETQCCTSKLISDSMPPRRQKFRGVLHGKDDLLEAASRVAGRLRQVCLHKGQRCLIPSADFETVRNVLGEVHNGTHDRAINGRRNSHRCHGAQLRIDQFLADAKAPQSASDYGRELIGQRPHVTGRDKDRKQRVGAHKEEKRSTINHEALDVPISQRCIRLQPRFARGRELSKELTRGTEDHHVVGMLPNGLRLSCGAILERSQTKFYHTVFKPAPDALRAGADSFKRVLGSTARSSPILPEFDEKFSSTLGILRCHPNPGRTGHEAITSAQAAYPEEILDPLGLCDVSDPRPIQRRSGHRKKRKIRRLEDRDQVAHTRFVPNQLGCRCCLTDGA